LCPDPYKTIFHQDHNFTNQKPVPFYSATPLFSVIDLDHVLPAKMSTFSKEDTTFLHGCANESSCVGELGSMTVQS
jgi:hypothetical protein